MGSDFEKLMNSNNKLLHELQQYVEDKKLEKTKDSHLKKLLTSVEEYK